MRVRLFGIDAPERDQSCAKSDGTRYSCGQLARDALARAIGDSSVRCTKRDVDKYGRMVGVCRTDAGDLSETLVLGGAAVAYRHFSHDYVDEEERARRAGAGIWQGSFDAPWDWRQRSRAKHPR